MNLQRINELAKKQREQGLTEEEKQEQALLRQEYIVAFRESLRGQLDSTYVLDKDGNKVPIKEFNKTRKNNVIKLII